MKWIEVLCQKCGRQMWWPVDQIHNPPICGSCPKYSMREKWGFK